MECDSELYHIGEKLKLRIQHLRNVVLNHTRRLLHFVGVGTPLLVNLEPD